MKARRGGDSAPRASGPRAAAPGVAPVVALAALAALGLLLTAAGCRTAAPSERAGTPAAEVPARGRAGELFSAAQGGDLAAVGSLLSADPRLARAEDAAGWNAAAYAAWYGHVQLYQYLLGKGVPTNVFSEAALGPFPSFVSRLQTNPLAVNARDGKRKAPPLIWAARGGNRTGAEFLLSLGADPNIADGGGVTALAVAAGRGDAELAELLLRGGARVQAADAGGRTPLHAAAAAGGLALCTLLLDAGAAVNAADREGETPLHLAAQAGGFELCEYLLFRGAAAALRDRRGLTPAQLALESGHLQVAELLRAHEG